MSPKGDRPTPLRVRLPAETHAALAKAAQASGRSLTKEMELRLTASVNGDLGPTSPYYGWPPEDEKRFRSLGNVAGILCAQVDLTIGTGAPQAFILGAVRDAMIALLDGAGAAPMEADNQKFFTMVARQMLAEIRHAAKTDAPVGQKAAFADFARAWKIEEKTGEIK